MFHSNQPDLSKAMKAKEEEMSKQRVTKKNLYFTTANDVLVESFH